MSNLSCKTVGNQWVVAMNKWQTLTDMVLSQDVLSQLSEFCSEFLVHAADVEGLCNGIDQELVKSKIKLIQSLENGRQFRVRMLVVANTSLIYNWLMNCRMEKWT